MRKKIRKLVPQIGMAVVMVTFVYVSFIYASLKHKDKEY